MSHVHQGASEKYMERVRAGKPWLIGRDGDARADCPDCLAREAEIERLREALKTAHGTAQAMADMDSWIATECGMVDDEEHGEWFIPEARQALEETNAGEGT